MNLKLMMVTSGLLLSSVAAYAKDMTIRLPADTQVSRKVVPFRCDAGAERIGLPRGGFEVEYINAGPNSLAVLPMNGNRLIFAGVQSGSGARYTAGDYTWWEAAGRRTFIRSESLGGNREFTCYRDDRR